MEAINKSSYRPLWHFAPQQNWINDPNGLVFFKGEYHLFYQYHPQGTTWGPMHWGHAVSTDLVQWEELEIALYPDENGTIFSGSAVVDWHNTTGFFPDEPGLVAIFTSHSEGKGEPVIQTQSLAYSRDNGRTWTKYEGNPVLRFADKEDFRDPKVFWHKDSGKWIMVLATGQTITLYSSPDLKSWKLESEFGDDIGFHGGVWECPDLFPLTIEGTDESKWVLLVSVGDSPDYNEGSRTQYFVGSFDGSVFTPDDAELRWLDYGRDNYAGVSFSDIPDEDGRRIYIAWMSNWRYANHVPSNGFRGSMTAARTLGLKRRENGDVVIVQHPVQELENYFSNERIAVKDVVLADGRKEVIECSLEAFELRLEAEPLEAKEFGLIIHHNEEQYTTIQYSTDERVITLLREHAGPHDFSDMFAKPQQMKLEPSDSLNLRILVDAASIELLLADGTAAMTSLIFPDQTCQKITLFASGGTVQLASLTVLAAK
ncbi:glycoside hydrolase family 32 protein [Paenibacillus glycanilyticus]|uniref:glycoside hydrolase family 32 protein n=1 Tax=Paenibacillus glycanilyticus TaxID=126569 RepID=UPI00203C9D42|nr:glycoside hydrolase family 32 protein [Paenibacillus glycanilyticus]MCM3630475.1 glycoside hydrolase family 32 protein [Paenibacillus glycanilyticus]